MILGCIIIGIVLAYFLVERQKEADRQQHFQQSDYFAQTGLLVPARKDSAKMLDNEKERVFLDSIENSRKTPVTKDYKRITIFTHNKNG